jgi:hypothetical protein
MSTVLFLLGIAFLVGWAMWFLHYYGVWKDD